MTVARLVPIAALVLAACISRAESASDGAGVVERAAASEAAAPNEQTLASAGEGSGGADRDLEGSDGAGGEALDGTPSDPLGLRSRAAPRNVVLLIGDGMGPVHEEAASRWLHGAPERLVMHGAPHRTTVTTHCATEKITDSAAAATAMATGRKVAYEAVSVRLPGDGAPLETVLEEHLGAGRVAGLVSTSRLTHATPAAYAAHVPNRWEEHTIAEQMLASGTTLLFGGGGRGMTEGAASAAGYAVATDAASMRALDPSADKWAFFFGGSHLPFVDDGARGAPTLAEMTSAAIALLDARQSGFFLVVEGARIDHASHSNNLALMLPEVAALDDALATVLEWAAERQDTLVLLTADHETGGLSLVEHGEAGTLPAVEWSTLGHTETPVNLYAWGPFADVIVRARDNTDLYALSRWPLQRSE